MYIPFFFGLNYKFLKPHTEYLIIFFFLDIKVEKTKMTAIFKQFKAETPSWLQIYH